jgi:hypothetical protein
MNNLNNFSQDFGIYLQPGEKISPEFLEKLREVNNKYTEIRSFPKYQKDLLELFQLQSPPNITKEVQAYLAGFIEGEGSLNAGIQKNSTSTFGLYIDPEFSVTQHVNGMSNLYLILTFFQTGRIRHKNGSNATFVFTIDNRVSLEEKVVPFYEKYTLNFSVPYKKRRTNMFKKLLQLFNEKAHLDQTRLLDEVLPLWDALRMQKGQSNQSFSDLENTQQYVKDYMKGRSRRSLN